MTHVQLFVRHVMQTPWCLGVMGFLLVFVPILGMWAILIMVGNIGNHLTNHLTSGLRNSIMLWLRDQLR